MVADADLGQPLGEVVTDGELSRCARHLELFVWVVWRRGKVLLVEMVFEGRKEEMRVGI